MATVDTLAATFTGVSPASEERTAVVHAPDAESHEWVVALRASGPAREAAVERLHALLLRAARFEVGRRRGMLPYLSPGDLDELALDAADDALMSVLAKLDDFRGASRFTTWVYKFALLEAAAKLRRRAWRGREVPLEPEALGLVPSLAAGPERETAEAELLRTLTAAIAEVLTPHQRRVLVALALNGVPIDVLADRLGTTRGALYKTLHDARSRLRRHLLESGVDVGRWLEDRE